MTELLAGRYLIGAVLSASALSVVHRGHDTQLDRAVSVTLLRRELVLDEASVGLFAATTAVQAEISHPGIVGLYDAGLADCNGVMTPWAVGELVLGFNIDEFVLPVHLRGRWGATLLELADQVAQAMQHAHVDGAVHGNLSPSTVLLDLGAGDLLRARITGFGPQAADLAVPSDPQITRQMWQTFTEQLEYPSPEQRAGRAPTRRSDIYGFGCVLAALLLLGERADEGARAVAAIAEQAMSESPSDRQYSFTVVREQLRAIGGAPAPQPSRDDTRTVVFAPGTTAVGTPHHDRRPEPLETTELRYLGVSPHGPRRVPYSAREDRAAGPQTPGSREGGRGRDRSLGGWLFAALAAVTLLVGGLGWGINGASSEPAASVTIPSVAGEELASATRLLGSLGLSLGGQVSRADAAVAVGLVAATDPVAGSRVRAGQAVTLVISTGPDARTVPQLTGLGIAAAQEALAAAGLVAGAVVERDGLNAPGMVLGSTPEFGAAAAAGAAVEIVVSSGNQAVPRGLEGQAGAAASQTLAAAGLAPQLVEQTSSEVAPGVVLEVRPGAGTSLPLGAIVTLVIAVEAVPEPLPTSNSPTPTSPPAGAGGR